MNNKFFFVLTLLAVAPFAFSSSNVRELNCTVGSKVSPSSLPSATNQVEHTFSSNQCALYNSRTETRVEKVYGNKMAKVTFLDGSSAVVDVSTLSPAVESYVGASSSPRMVLYNARAQAQILVRYANNMASIKFPGDSSVPVVSMNTLAWEVSSHEDFSKGVEVLYNHRAEAKVLTVFNNGMIEVKFLSDGSKAMVAHGTLLRAN